MIWIHCGENGEAQTTASLVARLVEHCDPEDVLITCMGGDQALFDTLPTGVNIATIPVDAPTKVGAFLDHWHPSNLIWIGGRLRAALLRAVRQAHIPATLINARTAGLFGRRARWLPGATKSAVAGFDRIMTADGATATRLTRGGVSRDRVQITGPILEEPIPLPHNPNEFTVMSEAIGARPMWLAADVVDTEIKFLTSAHLAASRRNHRLLLIITLRKPASGPQIADTMRDAGLRVGLRSEGDDPDPEQQVYIADLADELGIWYRLAPLTFVGGTMAPGGATSPLDAIMLGSAVIHGTYKAPFATRFARLAKVEACREIRSASELGVAVGALISPEQTARIALAGWSEMSHNSQTLNQLVTVALDGATP